MMNIQVLASIFGLVMAYLSFLHYKRKEFNRYQFIIWEVLWCSFIVVTLLPDRFNLITEKLGIARAFDLFAIGAFIVIMFLTFHNYLLITKLEKRLEDRVRTNTLDDLPTNNKPEKQL
ncbi:MAG: hypothetical protein ACD_43C00272G0008 [uncultured bacterium]|nr:MAG: hypothetical protein ACD_43C00272G0008 [uncultured bacterium]